MGKAPDNQAKSAPKSRQFRNKDFAEQSKGSENTGKHPESVKSSAKEAGAIPTQQRGYSAADRKRMSEEILARISEGEPLRQICRDANMPGWVTVYSWMNEDKALLERFARAREKGEEAIAQECLDIADNANNDWMERADDEGKTIGWQLNGEHVQRSKLRIETRLKLLAKWNPRKWGEKLEVGGENGGPMTVIVRDYTGRKQNAD